MMSETVVTIDPSRNNAQQQQQQHQQSQQPKPATAPAGSLSWIKLNIGYFQSIPGILKLVELILGIICMALASPALIGATHWFLFVAVISFIGTLLWTFVYLLGIREVLNLAVNWILTELLNTGLVTVFYTIAFIVQLAAWSGYTGFGLGSNITAGVFGLFNTVAYAGSTYFLYLEHKAGTTQ